ncbi:hypothetical protein C8C76_104121 [Halanaerobium saccharolyticum]|jgi:hypothetical protein|uniref:Uncharacterized protein n=1 Tax=Halanaerobium saccharolyticum TaxID=43595 RepID=A0A2T5RPM6_9FIRM|nr:hypothetical protein [Halanaerobium saccharolyticum]PTW01767.1 hypothetical protein C8C76_104121 [Halanaerobium saccharolyticum]
MKKQLLIGVITAALFLISTLLFPIAAASDQQDINSGKEDFLSKYYLNEQGIIKPRIAEIIINYRAENVIQAIAAKDFAEVAEYVHPKKGLRFTPYTYVREEKDVVMTKEEVSDFFEDDKKYLWGSYDGSGKEIRLTPAEYYHEFIYTANFIKAEEIGYNEVLSSGNMLENQFEVYDNPIIVEYYFSGFKPKFEGMDWQSLRLVFEKYQGDWKLTGIIHNQWTI